MAFSDYELEQISQQVRKALASNSVIEEACWLARVEGRSEMLESIRASLKGYPDVGGDICIMQEVDRIVKEAIAPLQPKITEDYVVITSVAFNNYEEIVRKYQEMCKHV